MDNVRNLTLAAKRLLCLILVLTMVVGLLPITAKAAYEDWMFDDDGEPNISPKIKLISSGFTLKNGRNVADCQYRDSTLNSNVYVHYIKVSPLTANGYPDDESPLTAPFLVKQVVAFCGDHSKKLNTSHEGETWSNPVDFQENPYLVYYYTMYYNTLSYYDQGHQAYASLNGIDYEIWSDEQFMSEMAVAQAVTWGIVHNKIPDVNSDRDGYINKVAQMRVEAIAAIGKTLETNTTTTLAAEKKVVEQILKNYEAGKYQKFKFVVYTHYDGSKNQPDEMQPMVVALPYRTKTAYPYAFRVEVPVKTDAEGNPIPGAKFGVYLDASCTVPAQQYSCYYQGSVDNKIGYTFISGEDGKATSDFLTIPGTDKNQKPSQFIVYIKEEEAPEGFRKSDEVIPVVVKAENMVYAPGGDGLSSCAPVQVRVPDSWDQPVNGAWVNLVPHYFYVKLDKQDEAGHPLAGAKFGIYTDPQCLTPITANSSTSATFTTQDTDNVYGPFLLPTELDTGTDVTLYLKEISAPSGYTASSEIKSFTVTQDQLLPERRKNDKNTFADAGTVVNDKSPDHSSGEGAQIWIKFRKVDENGLPIGGATFKVFAVTSSSASGGGENRVELDTFRVRADQTKYGPFTIPSDYLAAHKDNLIIGIEETSAPVGYQMSENPYSWSVIGSTADSYLDHEDNPVPFQDMTNMPDEPEPTVVTPATLKKVDSRTGQGIGPATFRFTGAETPDYPSFPIIPSVETIEELMAWLQRAVAEWNSHDYVDIGGVHNYEFQTDANGILNFQWQDPAQANYIAPGLYYVTELQAPAGYERTMEGQWIELSIDDNGNAVASGSLVFKNDKLHTVRIVKLSADGTQLPGAVFNVYRDGQLISSGLTTGANGELVFDGANHEGITSGYYEFEEVTPPAGYMLPENNRIGIKIDASDPTIMEHVLTVTNYEYPDIVIEKKEKGTDTPLSGATFEVFIDAQSIGEFVSNEEGKVVIDYGAYGDYLTPDKNSWTVAVREIAPPSGYLLNDNTLHELQIRKGEKLASFVFEDTPYIGISILKLDAETNQPLSGADFEVMINGHSIGTKTTNGDGQILIDYDSCGEFLGDTLASGWTVAVREVKAPAGYMIEDYDWQISSLVPGQKSVSFTFRDPKYPEIHIVKQNYEHTAYLPGTEFEVMIDGRKVGSFTTGADGKIDLTYDQYHEFLDPTQNSWTIQVRETKAPAGYVITDNTWHTVELLKGQTETTFEFKDSEYPVIRILKIDRETGEPLAGAVFEIRIDDEILSPGSFMTDANGIIEIDYEHYREFLKEGKPSWTVAVRETQAPDAHFIDDFNWRMTELQLNQGLATFVFTDTAYPDIMIQKTEKGTNKPLAGAKFEVFIDAQHVDEFTTNEDGQIVLDHDVYGEFLDPYKNSWTVGVREVGPASGYLLDDDELHELELRKGEKLATFTFEDTPYGGIAILKLDAATNKPLAGADFEVMINGHSIGTKTTDANGQILIDYESCGEFFGDPSLDEWTVSVREVTAPAGYMVEDSNWQTAVLKAAQKSVTFTFRDHQYPELHIVKKDYDGKTFLPGAEFEVMIDGRKVGTFTTNAEGKIDITYERFHEYMDASQDSWTIQVRETKAPAGYVITDNTWHTIELLKGQPEATFEFKDSEYPVIRIQKLDRETGEPLRGAMFEIRIDHEILTPGSFMTDKNGVIEIDYEHYKDFLTSGKTSWTVAVRETQAPDGYLIDDYNWHMTELKLSQGLATFVFTDTAYPEIVIVKKDKETGAYLPNTTFQILIDGAFFGTRTTDKDGKITITYDEYRRFLDEENYDNWTITVTEVEAPEGYNKDLQATTNSFTLTQQLKVGQKLSVFEFQDTALRDILVYKRDAVNGNLLAGATFRLHCVKADGLDGGNITDRELTTDERGYVVFENVPNGTYEITEVTPPEGFQPAEDKTITVTVSSDSDRVMEFSFKNEPKSGLIIRKIDSLTKQPVTGVWFRITPLAPLSGAPIEAETNENGMIVLEHLDPGTYHVEEIATADGYTLNTTSQDVVIVNQHELFTVLFTNDQQGMLNIFKTDSLTGAALAGAEFTVTNGTRVYKVVTGENGYASIPVMDAGWYKIVETKAPYGYVLDSTPINVEVKVGENKTVEVKNVPDSALYITKIDAVTHAPIAGAVFELYSGLIGTGAFTVVGQYVTDEHGMIHTGPLKPGPYAIKEIVAPSGYLLDDSYHEVVVYAGHYNNIVIENQKAATLVVRKIDSRTGKPIPGAVFKVESADRMDLIGTLETDANGEAIFTGLNEGAYIVTETQAPDGYQLSDPSQKTIWVEAGKHNYCEFTDAKNGSLVITLREQDTGKELYNGEFRVTRESDQIVVFDGSTDTTGTIVVGDLVPGWYFVEQIYAPDGYTMVTKELHVEVLAGRQQRVYFEDVTSGLIIEKYDSKDPSIMLEGARFQVKRESDGIVVGEYVTGKDGKVTVSKLAPGRYTVTELVAPDGYNIDEGPKTIEVIAGTLAHVAFKDTAFGGITVKVVDKATQLGISGAVVEVWRQNGTLVNTYTTDRTGTFMTDKLTDGYYVLKLTHIPDGYTAAVTEATVEIRNGNPVTYTFELSMNGSLKIVSKSTYGQAVPGTTFTVSRPNGEVIGTYITGPNGSVSVSGLLTGWYVVTPGKAPSDYTFSSMEGMNVLIESGKLSVSEFVLQVLSSVRIRFVDGVTGDPVYGVRLQVRETKTNGSIHEFYSDNAGYVTLDKSFLTGTYVIEMISAPAGYIVDGTPKSIEVLAASTTNVTWRIYPEGGQIQVILKSADYNAVLNQAAGTALQGAVFEIMNADTYQIVGRIMTDARGVAASAALPVGRYIVTQVAASPYYHTSTASSEVRIKLNNDVVQTSFTNKSVNLKTSVSMQTNNSISAGNSMRVDILSAANNSDVELDNFFVHVKVPTDAVRVSTFSTGAWNTAVGFKISIKTNMRDYYTLADNLISTNVYNYDLSSQALGLQAGEYVTDIRLEYGTVPAGFNLKTKMAFMEYVMSTVYDQYKLINRVEVGGQHNTVSLSTNPGNPNFVYSGEAGMGAVSGNSGAWSTAVALWTSTVKSSVKMPDQLPKTGY